mmetsp:Transcript_6703/g.23683  ORF Transcript_6703/g.23683 Transcript_6703/m.23683 type:complete len:239 (+) Transcript_6703:651-1367(+)
MRSSGRAALGALRGLRNGAPFAMPKRAMSNVQKPLNGSRKGFRGRDAIVFESRSAYASTSRGPPRALTPRGTWHCRRRGALRLGRKGSADLGSRFVEDPSTRTRAAFGQTRTRAPPWFLAGPGPDPDPGPALARGSSSAERASSLIGTGGHGAALEAVPWIWCDRRRVSSLPRQVVGRPNRVLQEAISERWPHLQEVPSLSPRARRSAYPRAMHHRLREDHEKIIAVFKGRNVTDVLS